MHLPGQGYSMQHLIGKRIFNHWLTKMVKIGIIVHQGIGQWRGTQNKPVQQLKQIPYQSQTHLSHLLEALNQMAQQCAQCHQEQSKPLDDLHS